MPHINRIRVNNVKYNFGTQFYDDFVMRFSCKNTIYDLANGGGKSVLMLLLLQNLIPNCTLDEKQPIEKLFRPGNDNQTIHSLVEWKLNASDVKNGFQYMTTGFCARKAKENGGEEQEKETASIEYFNYCILYKDFNDNDIINLPLSNGKERITFTGLRNYLKDLGRKDYGLQIYLFDKKGDYQQFISEYGLYQSEWEIIRGINKTEGHVRTYFETHYRTTRKIVEDLFIEEIIEKSFYNKVGTGDDIQIAKTLLDIKDKLIELSKKKSQMENYNRQIEILEGFNGRLQSLKGIYGSKSELEEMLVKTYYTAKQRKQQEEQQLVESREQIQFLQEKQHVVEGEMEAVKLQIEENLLHKMEQEVELLLCEVEQLERSCGEKEKALHQKEAGNDYLDYLENEKQLNVHRNTLQELMNKNEGLLEELYTLAYNRKLYHVQEKAKLEQEASEQEQDVLQIKEQLSQLDGKERESEKRVAVLEYEEQSFQAEMEQSTSRLEARRQQIGILLLENLDSKTATNAREQLLSKTRLQEMQDVLRSVTGQISDMKFERVEREQECKQAEKQLQEVKTLLDGYRKQEERIRQMKQIYEEKNTESLLETITYGYKNQITKIAQLKAEIEKKEDYLQHFHKHLPIMQGLPTRQLLSYIRRHYDAQAEFGAEYIGNLQKEEQKELLERLPFLPYAIIVTKNFQEISVDANIRKMELGDTLIPFVEKTLVNQDMVPYDMAKLYFALKDNEVFYDEEMLEERICICRKEIEESKKNLLRMEDGEKVLKEDIAFLNCFQNEYEGKSQEWTKRYEQLKEDVRKHDKQQDETLVAARELEERKNTLYTEMEKEQVHLTKLVEDAELLEQIRTEYDSFKRLEKSLGQVRVELASSKKLRKEIADQIQEMKVCADKKAQILDNIKSRLKDLIENWRAYESYDVDGNHRKLALSAEELDAAFLGKKRAFEQKNADVSDKQKLVESYESAVQKSLLAIQYQGIELVRLQKLYENHQITRVEMEQMLKEKDLLQKERLDCTNRSKELMDRQSKMNRQQGSIQHGKKLFEEKFGEYKALNMEADALQMFLQESIRKVQDTQLSNKEKEKHAKEMEQQIYLLDSMNREMLHMIENCGISLEKYSGTLEYGVSLKSAYDELRKNYESLIKEEEKRRVVFEKDKLKLIETIHLLGAYDLAQEIEKSIQIPQNLDAVVRYITNLNRTIECILLEKERIERGIENMEAIKVNFVDQCLQTCSSIKNALERLPGLSVIQLDDKQVSMIRLQIPYIREELYKEAMSNYIDSVVEGTDSLSTSAERLKYIRNHLAWKKLFSVIVKDMDRIKLQLYKRERMKEQSRYLKYEEAVGSTGQSQGIYIQFLVAVINYIASLNCRSAEAAVLKKVIFIDNPFGAAKDTYIWEPIFRLLKSNNVQLIVPARGATPAITGKFEVNYILGQKLINGKQQTVVVDYRSQVREEMLEYRTLEFEQASLF